MKEAISTGGFEDLSHSYSNNFLIGNMQESRDVYELVTILRPLSKPSKIMIQRQERNLQSPWCFVDVPVAKAGHPTIAMAR